MPPKRRHRQLCKPLGETNNKKINKVSVGEISEKPLKASKTHREIFNLGN